MENSVALAAIALAGTITAGFFAMVNRQNKTHEKIATGLKNLANATAKGNREAEERNSHLADLVIETAKIVREQKAVREIVKEKL